MLEPQKKRICSACVGEGYLQSAINKHGRTALCSYCKAIGRTFSIEEMANRVDFAFEQHFLRTVDEPSDFEMMMQKEGDYDWERRGDPVVEVIQWCARIDSAPAEDIRRLLEERHEDFERDTMGEEGPFDGEAYYVEKDVDDREIHADWLNFERSLQTQTRFFNAVAEATLSSIFEDVADHKTLKGRSVVVKAGSGKRISELYRARVFQSEGDVERAIMRPDLELGPPPPSLASAGRMNARGISVFYGATRPAVALAEVRPPVGSRVVIARFQLCRPLRLLDVEALRSILIKGSIFDPDWLGRLEKGRFLGRLSARVTMPVMPADEPLDYLITQAIADYLSTKLGIDGIIYPSVQTGTRGRNVALFHESSCVERLPGDTALSADVGHFSDEGFEIEYLVWEEPMEAATKPQYRGELDPRAIALKVDPKSLKVHHVDGVRFRSSAFPVKRYKFEKSEPPF